jgi:hypothetical protein
VGLLGLPSHVNTLGLLGKHTRFELWLIVGSYDPNQDASRICARVSDVTVCGEVDEIENSIRLCSSIRKILFAYD